MLRWVFITGKSIEFVPGPIVGIENNQFATAYAAMAQKAGFTMAQAAEMRYEIVQEQLADSRTPPRYRRELHVLLVCNYPKVCLEMCSTYPDHLHI